MGSGSHTLADVAVTAAEMIGHALVRTGATATVAWCVAGPLALHHFGMICPLTVPLSVIALPLVAVVLCLGGLFSSPLADGSRCGNLVERQERAFAWFVKHD